MDYGVVVRRVMAADNNCLFSAIGYVMEKRMARAAELRQVIADAVASDPGTYSEVVLEKPPVEYRRWILKPESWGGAIELSILCQHYATEVAAYDIQTMRCDVYGQEKGYSQRVLLVYDGLHYDALALAPFADAPEDADQTIFDLAARATADAVHAQALQFVRAANRERKFTDTQNFTLRCAVCQKGLKGQKEAADHARSTGHTNFQEYS